MCKPVCDKKARKLRGVKQAKEHKGMTDKGTNRQKGHPIEREIIHTQTADATRTEQQVGCDAEGDPRFHRSAPRSSYMIARRISPRARQGFARRRRFARGSS
eukprot:6173591-Pleurochrysis_carterae.AAC.3